jgi:hypothetical protein
MTGIVNEALTRLVPLYDDETADWQEVLDRAGLDEESDLPARALRERRAWRLPRGRLLVAVFVSAIGLTGGATAVAYHYLGPSPGFTGGISALNRLPAISSLPSSISAAAIANAAAYAGISPDEAIRRTRLIRSGSQGDLYAFEGTGGTACMLLAARFSNCMKADNPVGTSGHPGVMATISPGYPGDTPVFVALVADDVSAMSVSIDGHREDLAIANNAVYVDMTELKRGDSIFAEALYGNGTRKSFPLANPYGE